MQINRGVFGRAMFPAIFQAMFSGDGGVSVGFGGQDSPWSAPRSALTLPVYWLQVNEIISISNLHPKTREIIFFWVKPAAKFDSDHISAYNIFVCFTSPIWEELMKIPFIFFLILFSAISFNKKSFSHDTMTLTHETTDGSLLGRYTSIFEDKEGNATFDEILSGKHDDKFFSVAKDSLSFGFNSHPLWFRIKLTNPESINKEFFLEIGYALLDDIKLFVPDGNGSYRERRGGDKKPYSVREYDHQNFIFPIKQEPGTASYYLRVKTTSSFNVPIRVWDRKHLDNRVVLEFLFQGIFLGIFIIMIFYNLFVYVGSRDFDYLAYTLFLIPFTILNMTLNGLGFRFLWSNILWLNDSTPLFVTLANAGGYFFSIHYLSTKRHTPRLHRLIASFMVLSLILASISYVLPYTISIKISTYTQLLGITVLIATGFYYLKIKSRAAYFLVPSWTVFMIGAAITTFKNLGILPPNVVTTSAYQVGAIIQVILFSLGLADKIRSLKNDLQNMNLNLEKKVDERTEELQAALAKLQVTNGELVDTRDALWGEMQLAKKIQTVLLPKNPMMQGYQVLGYMQTAEEVGGDYYDVINAGDHDWFVIGDVSGHGVSAGLVMMMVQTATHILLRHSPNTEPSELLTSINETIANNIRQLGEDRYMTITVFAAHQKGRFIYSGLHQDILIYRAETDKVEAVETEGIWLGVVDDIDGMGSDRAIELQQNDVLLLYTDGVVEAVDSAGKMYGHEKLSAALKVSGTKSVEEIRDAIISDLEGYKKDDDVTILILKRDALS